jgi:RNA polymerase sigma-70 factor (ECF subfamily)
VINRIKEIQAGNTLIFEEVYYQFHERLYWYVWKRTNSETLAEDVVQESFMKFWDTRENLSLAFPLEVQLARIVRTTLIDHLRKESNQRKALISLSKNVDQPGFDNNLLLKKELEERVHIAVQELSPECKKIFQLSREGGFSYTQIASMLSISPKTVENQISKALRLLRKAVLFL